MVNSGDFRQDRLQRAGNDGFHLLGGCAWILDKNVHHRHRDLRVFLSGGDHQPQRANREEAQQQ